LPFVVVVVVVVVVAVVPAVPRVAVVPEVPEVAVELIVPVPLVSVESGTVVSIVAVVAVVADTEVSVVTVSVLVFSCFLQPNTSSATASRAKSVIEKDFFIASSPEVQFDTTGELQREDVSGTRARGAILETSLLMSSDPARLLAPVSRSVVSFDGTSIAYDIHDAGSRSAVIVVPGFWRERKHPSMVALAALLNSHGYTAVVTDPRGHGESGGTYGFNLLEHYDTAAVAKDVLGQLPIESITLVGLSYGAAVAISTAARHEVPIKSLLLISPVADFSMISPRINPFTIHHHIAFSLALRRPRFEWRARKSPKLRPLDDVGNVHVPICLIHVRNDWLISHKHSVALYEAANEPKELHVIEIPGNYHADRIFRVASDSIEPIFLDFLRRHSSS
jgi:pimeloyl-ACP methyl ester carboxylesterase